MSQSTLSDDDLFGEAAREIRDDVEEHLAAARAELPDEEVIWETDAENTVGVLNALRSALDVGDADAHLRDARKWYTMGERADAFEGGDDLEDELEALVDLVEEIETAREHVGELTGTVSELRSTLSEFEDGEGETDDGE